MKVKVSLSFLLAALLVSPAFAVKFVPLSVEHLTAKAHVILHGTVREKICLRDPAGRIYTKVSVEVHENWKGAGNPAREDARPTLRTFMVVQAGGTIGEQRMEVDGQENLEIAE